MNRLFFLFCFFTFPVFCFSQISFWQNYITSTNSGLGAFNIAQYGNVEYSFVSGYNNMILSYSVQGSHVFGDHCKTKGGSSFAIGNRAEATSQGAFSLGTYIKSTQNLSMTIGFGYWSSNYSTNLVNNIPNSLMIGFNSQSPTLFVGPANGVDSIGTVMIGTTSLPSAAQGQGYIFAVNGYMIAEKIKTSTYNNWSDYVFKKDYSLMSLNQVEEYINKNSHLPDLPSAEEVKKNGYDFAAMDATLLRKIEELYLLIIDLEKENKKLKYTLQHE